MPDFRYIPHKELKDRELRDICKVKALAFPYDVQSQEQWIRANITPDDIHVWYKPAKTILAYLNVVNINIEVDGRCLKGYGIGNVCARERGKGYGSMMMNEINRFLVESGKTGMLFCRNNIMYFYERSGWIRASRESVILSSPDHKFETMVYNCPGFQKIKYLGRLF